MTREEWDKLTADEKWAAYLAIFTEDDALDIECPNCGWGLTEINSSMGQFKCFRCGYIGAGRSENDKRLGKRLVSIVRTGIDPRGKHG